MTQEFIIAIFIFTLVSSVTPGPNNLMVMASSANFGALRTLPHIFGIVFGFQLMLLTVATGLARLFETFPQSVLILKILCVFVLVYLAWKIATADAPNTDNGHEGRPLTFLHAAAFQWVNPKAWILAIAGIGAYVAPEQPITSFILISICFLISGAVAFTSWTFIGSQISRMLTNSVRLKAFNWTCALALLATLWPMLTATQI